MKKKVLILLDEGKAGPENGSKVFRQITTFCIMHEKTGVLQKFGANNFSKHIPSSLKKIVIYVKLTGLTPYWTFAA
jgi:hypothetical protein